MKNHYSLKINGHNYIVEIGDVNENMTLAHVKVNGTLYDVEIAGAERTTVSKPQVVPAPAAANSAQITPATASASPVAAAASGAVSGAPVKCPLPGTVVSIKVAVGDKVTPGQNLLVLEAMKMENNIDADRAGVVKQIFVQQGATVMEGDNLLIIE